MAETLFDMDKYPANAIITYAKEIKNNAPVNFSTDVGSLVFFLRIVQKLDIIGANMIIKSGYAFS